ncbi:MAG: hypothetical protein KGQ93_01645 [Cyanobacteria bacterium REEB459]|nr:hypothetical protein [Cyanobacteria bacterium REEB459]
MPTDSLNSAAWQSLRSTSSTAILPARSDSSESTGGQSLPYTADQQVQLLHLQAEIDVLLLRLQALSIRAESGSGTV